MPDFVRHINVITPDMTADEVSALVDANSDAVDLSNAAVRALYAGQPAEAERLHRAALALKLRAYGEASVQAAISFNGLGEALLRLGRLADADAARDTSRSARQILPRHRLPRHRLPGSRKPPRVDCEDIMRNVKTHTNALPIVPEIRDSRVEEMTLPVDHHPSLALFSIPGSPGTLIGVNSKGQCLVP
ncbi:hypothetical protein GGR52DRAFT_592977 [Hypoxylon sp. FL1284]|nr:hypothetical protein GGR52DRAFT_592977 [Hypoxylon sp. FL1284]